MGIAIIGVDPGLSTGLAEIVDGERRRFFQGSPKDALHLLDDRLKLHNLGDNEVIVACESFKQSGRARMTPQPEAMETAVRVETISDSRGVRYVSQTPADAKRVASNALLQASGLWVLPSDISQKDANDVNDAMRHAVLAMSRYKATMFGDLLARAVKRQV